MRATAKLRLVYNSAPVAHKACAQRIGVVENKPAFPSFHCRAKGLQAISQCFQPWNATFAVYCLPESPSAAFRELKFFFAGEVATRDILRKLCRQQRSRNSCQMCV